MNKITIVLMAFLLLGGTLACGFTVRAPDIDIQVPTLQVGEMQDERRSIPLAGAESAAVEILFGAGDLEIEAGTSDELFSGHFRYNVERWEPQITYDDDVLVIKQGGHEEDWAIPTGMTRNEWDLEFSPEIPLEMDITLGAGEGSLDFTGLQLAALDVDMGAGDFTLRFDEPNEIEMEQLTLDTGASKLEVRRVGNASPKRVKLQGGVGNITLDLTGAWARSAEVRITTGVGSLTLRLPDDVGVRVETEGGLSHVESSGLEREGNLYVNDAFGEADSELHITITTGVGNVRLIGVSND
jgi:hypothetical protein